MRRLMSNLKVARDELWARRYPEPGVCVDFPEFWPGIQRLNEVTKAANRHSSLMGSRRSAGARLQRVHASMEAFRAGLAEGKTFVAFDCEWHRSTQVTLEIGVTVYRDGVTTSYNLRVNTGHGATGKFDFGNTEVLAREACMKRFVELCEQADFYVGHSLSNDFDHLRQFKVEVPYRPVFDTQSWGRKLIGHQASLSTLAGHYGVDCPRPHVGGNDARYTWEVMLRMAQTQASLAA